MSTVSIPRASRGRARAILGCRPRFRRQPSPGRCGRNAPCESWPWPSCRCSRWPRAPEPQKIVFARVWPNAGQVGLFIADADGGSERPLVGLGEIDYDPVWSPDGPSIVFTSDRNGSADLYRVKPDGTGLERLTDSPAYDDQAAFSPDGKQLVFVTTRNGGTADLWTMDLQTKTGEGADVRARRRLPAGVVARRQVDRLLVRSRQHDADGPRPLGASAARRRVSRCIPTAPG